MSFTDPAFLRYEPPAGRSPAPAGDARVRPNAAASVTPRVVLYSASGCHLCDAARRVLERVRADVDFELDDVDITGDAALEAAYRELLPVVEIDGRRVFVYYVEPEALRRKLGAQGGGARPGL